MLLLKKTIPDPEDVKRRYQTDLHSGNYIKFRQNDNPNYRYLFSYFEMAADLVAEHRPSQLLDLGCGSAPLMRRIAERLPECRQIGVDVSAPLCRACDPFAAVQGDARLLPFADHSFDMVTCVAVSELFSTDVFKHIMLEAARVTRPGGRLLIQYRNPFSLWEPYWWFYRYEYYQNAYSRARIRRLGEMMGLPVVCIQPTYLAAPPIVYRNHLAFYRGWMPPKVLAAIRRLDIGCLSRRLSFLCRHFIAVHRVAHEAGLSTGGNGHEQHGIRA